MKESYNTLSEASRELQAKGFTENFEVNKQGLLSSNNQTYQPNQITVAEFHRFEGMTNPADTSICYAIECEDGTKGLLIDAYGADASQNVSKFIEAIS